LYKTGRSIFSNCQAGEAKVNIQPATATSIFSNCQAVTGRGDRQFSEGTEINQVRLTNTIYDLNICIKSNICVKAASPLSPEGMARSLDN
jgi:hypothetical protein